MEKEWLWNLSELHPNPLILLKPYGSYLSSYSLNSFIWKMGMMMHKMAVTRIKWKNMANTNCGDRREDVVLSVGVTAVLSLSSTCCLMSAALSLNWMSVFHQNQHLTPIVTRGKGRHKAPISSWGWDAPDGIMLSRGLQRPLFSPPPHEVFL